MTTAAAAVVVVVVAAAVTGFRRHAGVVAVAVVAATARHRLHEQAIVRMTATYNTGVLCTTTVTSQPATYNVFLACHRSGAH